MQAIPVSMHQLSPFELFQLEDALRGEDKLANVFVAVGSGHAAAFRLFGSVQGVCVIQIHDAEDGRWLFVWLLAGKGILQHLGKLWELLEQVAISQDCPLVVAKPTEQLAKIYKARLGFVDHPAGVAKEIANGRRWRN